MKRLVPGISCSISVAFVFKGDLKPKFQPWFLWHIWMTLQKKSLVQSFGVFWSVLTKLWSYKNLNPVSNVIPTNVQNTPLLVSLHSFVKFMVKKPFAKIDSEFDLFSWTYQFCLTKFRLDVEDLIHANEHT